MKKIIINLSLFCIICGLSYYLFDIIYTPYKQNMLFEIRSSATKNKLNDIRIAQRIYKKTHKKYAKNFDSLTACIKYDSIKIVKRQSDSKSKKINLEIYYEPAMKQANFSNTSINLDSLAFIPLSHGERFEIERSSLKKNDVIIPTFQVIARKEAYLKGLPSSFIKGKKDLYIGDLNNPSERGNWQ